MISRMVNPVWHVSAEAALRAEFGFGDSGASAYIGDVAGDCVTDLPKGYFEIHPSPPQGPGRFSGRAFSFSPQPDLRRGALPHPTLTIARPDGRRNERDA
jgi:hypothetical protein